MIELEEGETRVNTSGKNRVETLSDGVFAVAMTLLVLGLSVPIISGASIETELQRKLLELLPKLSLYFLSFLILGVLWVNHHFLFRSLKQSNSRIVWLNLIMLMFAALLPFSTALVGEYWRYQMAVLIFGGNGILAFGMFIVLWEYSRHKNLLSVVLSPENIQIRKIVDITTMVILITAFVLSFFNPVISLFVYGIVIFIHITATFIGFHEYKSA